LLNIKILYQISEVIAMKNDMSASDFIEEFKKNKAKKDLGKYLTEKLNEEQSNRLNAVLSDEKALNELLSSEKAQRIIKELTGDDNG